MADRTRVSAMPAWFDATGEPPRLLGTRCRRCRSWFFPPEAFACRNPGCQARELDPVALSGSGTLWSFTDNHYAPPAPYVAPDPFEPYAIAAVELAAERMVVLGQVVPGVPVGALEVGMPMELVAAPLYADDEHEYLVWKWRPAGRGGR